MLTRIDGTPFIVGRPNSFNGKPRIRKAGSLWRCALLEGGVPVFGLSPETAFLEWQRMCFLHRIQKESA